MLYFAFRGTTDSDIAFGPGQVNYIVNNTATEANISINQGTEVERIEELVNLETSFHIMYY